jgi:signal peptidase II
MLWVIAIVVFALDRWSKAAVSSHFLPGESMIVVPHLLWFTYVQNAHGAFGMFGSQPALLIGLALAVLALFAFAFVGGAAGNIIDRIQHQYVVDFIDFKTIWPNVFNVADSCITIGVAVLILSSLRREAPAPADSSTR